MTLNGSLSTAPEGVELHFEWTQLTGSSVDLVPDPLVSNVSFVAPDVGPDGEDLRFLLTVSDSEGQFDNDTAEAQVLVLWVNDPPGADAGETQTVFEGDTVTLDGSGSSDPEGLPLSFKWVQTGGIAVTLTGAETAKPSFVAPAVDPEGASLSFKLTVTDSEGETAAGTCVVRVNSTNGPPVADAGGDFSVDEGAQVTLDGSKSKDPDGDPLTWLWTQEEGVAVELSDPAVAKPVFQAPNVDEKGTTMVFLLTVTDGEGLLDKDSCLITVLGANELPSVEAGDRQEVDEGDRVFLDGSSCKDPEGESLKYLWVQTDGVDVEIEKPDGAKASFTAPEVGPSGAYLAFDLFVEDPGGLKARDHCFVDVKDVDGQGGSSVSSDDGGGGCESGDPLPVLSALLLLAGSLLLRVYFKGR